MPAAIHSFDHTVCKIYCYVLRFKVPGGCLFNYWLREIPIEVGKKTEGNFVLTWLQVLRGVALERSGQGPCVRHAVSLASGG